jgi:uncharacterized protein (DUF433 family)
MGRLNPQLNRPMLSRGGWAMSDPTQMIVRDPAICGGQPVLQGTRVLLRSVLGYLAQGETPEAILADYPSLTLDHVWACIAFAAASMAEDLPSPPPAPKGTQAA